MIQVMAMFKELQLDSDSDFLDGFSVNSSTIDESAEKSTVFPLILADFDYLEG
jgi:hypothetical protein